MQITEEEIRQFQAIWREEFEEDVSTDEAREHIARLDAFYLLLARRPVREQGPAPLRTEDTQHP